MAQVYESPRCPNLHHRTMPSERKKVNDKQPKHNHSKIANNIIEDWLVPRVAATR